MFTKQVQPDWFIDPLRVAFGSVVDKAGRDLSRSHVRVRYDGQPSAEFVPLREFIRRCYEVIRGGRPLDIDHLLVAPILKQRHAKFFDLLTEWGPATSRAFGARPRKPIHPWLLDR